MTGQGAGKYPVWRADLLIWLFALCIRAIYLWGLSGSPLWFMTLGDSAVYDRWARGIALGDWLGQGLYYQAPLYPYFLGVVYAVAGPSLAVARFVQIVLGATACVLTARAGRRFFDRETGTTAGFLLAVFPTAVFFDGVIQKTSLDVFLMTVLLLCLARAEGTATARRWFIVGLALGFLALTRENSLVLAAVIVPWILHRAWSEGRRVAATRAALFAAGVVLVLVPVGLRNLLVGEEFHLTTPIFGVNFYFGNNPAADGTYAPLRPGRGDAAAERQDAVELAEQALGKKLSYGEVSRYWAGRALRFVTQQPGDWLRLTAKKLLLSLNRVELPDTDDQYSYGDWSPLLRWLTAGFHFGVLLPLAAAGLWLTRDSRRGLGILRALAAAYLASIVMFFILSRYRLPLVPVLVLFGAAGLAEAVRAARRRDWRRLSAAGAAALTGALVANAPVADAMVILDARSVMQSNIGVWSWKERHDADQALAAFRRAIALTPGAAGPYFKAGIVLQDTGRLAEALEFLQLAAKQEPRSAETHARIGKCLLDLGRSGEAVAAFRRAVAVEPGHRYSRHWLGVALARSGEENAASRRLGDAARLPAAPGK